MFLSIKVTNTQKSLLKAFYLLIIYTAAKCGAKMVQEEKPGESGLLQGSEYETSGWADTSAGFSMFPNGASHSAGSLCDSWSSRCYLLSVLDTLLVRRSWRRRGLGLQMLEDFCSSLSTEDFVGVSSPLSPSMAAGCPVACSHGNNQHHNLEVFEMKCV